ncbi:MAG: ABC transporter permease [Candidatus Hydrogenedentes bacterium]|nr:ABC transporter permease [Candidatus Hydrogenedentota bacterium]
MPLWKVAFTYAWGRRWPALLTILCVALGVSLITCVTTLRAESQKGFEAFSDGFDLLVAAKGDPAQVVLSTLFYLDVPVGSLSHDAYATLKDDSRVRNAYPVAIGDSYKGYRIVGTIPRYILGDSSLEGNPALSGLRIAEGRTFVRPLEVVLGARVAEEAGLAIGSRFVSTHGFDTELGHQHDVSFEVTGVLAKTSGPADVAIFTMLESVWMACGSWALEQNDHEHAMKGHSHEHPPNASPATSSAITAILLDLKPGQSAEKLAKEINLGTTAMAVQPRLEMERFYVKEMAALRSVLLSAGQVIVLISILSLATILYLSVLQRKRDLAIMRALGASTSDVFGLVMLEGIGLVVSGTIIGAALGHVLTWFTGIQLAAHAGLTINPWRVAASELAAYPLVLVCGIISGVIPAVQAYKRDVATDLVEE